MLRRYRLAHATPMLILLLAGCGRSTGPLAPSSAAGANQSTASTELARHPELIEEATYGADTQSPVASAGGGASGVAAAIRPLFFWRQILHVERSFEFAFADTDSTGQPATAEVTIHKQLSGWFNVVARDTTPDGAPAEGHVIRKPLSDHWVRRVLLRRVHTPDADFRPWRIAATSGVEVTSRDAETRIRSLRVQSGALDTTLTDPLAFFRLRRLLRLDPETDVTATVTTLRDDDVVVFYLGDRRFRFHNNGDHTYTATWRTSAFEGVRHFGVNALSNGSLFDDRAPYDSQAWILPFVVAPTEMADLAP